MIYVPNNDFNACYSIINNNTIRAYKTAPETGLNVDYRDYYVDFDYNYTESNILIESPVYCINNNLITDNIFYRKDIVFILLLFLILSYIIIYCPYKLFSRMFGRWLRI